MKDAATYGGQGGGNGHLGGGGHCTGGGGLQKWINYYYSALYQNKFMAQHLVYILGFVLWLFHFL
jgi:hypothetical protein